jgi:hypothetical protein
LRGSGHPAALLEPFENGEGRLGAGFFTVARLDVAIHAASRAESLAGVPADGLDRQREGDDFS